MRVGPSQNALGIPPEGLTLKQTSDLSQKTTMKDTPTSLPIKCWVEKIKGLHPNRKWAGLVRFSICNPHFSLLRKTYLDQ